jgi:hypothetical protein
VEFPKSFIQGEAGERAYADYVRLAATAREDIAVHESSSADTAYTPYLIELWWSRYLARAVECMFSPPQLQKEG